MKSRLSAPHLVNTLVQYGYTQWLGIPCSYLSPVIQCATEHRSIQWHPSTRESDSIAFACGLYLGGKRPVVFMQNSGLLNALDALSSLVIPYKIPLFMIVSYRGCPTSTPDAEHHHTTGKITEGLLELLEIPYRIIQGDESIPHLVNTALDVLNHTRMPYVLLVPQDRFQPLETPINPINDQRSLTRLHVLKEIAQRCKTKDLIVTTNGYTTREWLGMKSTANHFPVVGNMGSVNALGLGWASANPHTKITVIDGDGSFLMGLSAAVLPGLTQLSFRHIVLDNGRYESTGNQVTGVQTLDLAHIAQAMGYTLLYRVSTLVELQEALSIDNETPYFIHVHIKASVESCARPRPTIPLVSFTDHFVKHNTTLNHDEDYAKS